MPVNAMYDPYAAERNAMNPSALRRIVGAPTVDARVNELFGMQPGMDRLNFLPRYDSQQGWIAPNALYQVARALVSPGVAAQGGNVSPEDGVNFAGNVSLGSLGTSALLRNPAPGPGRALPMTVYHGSPHNFDAFDISKIGTGEGAQAYGHGLYVAESPGVAKAYQVKLARDPRDEINWVIDVLARKSGKGRVSATPDELSIELSKNPVLAPLVKDNPSLLKDIQTLAYGYDGISHTDAALSAARRMDSQLPAGKGNFYTVDLPDQHIANMLDWDKPLSQQPESVRKALQKIMAEHGATMDRQGSMTGGEFYSYISGGNGQFARQISEKLRANGIPGIRYLDGGSRGAGEGTSNYVVFDDKLLKILSKE